MASGSTCSSSELVLALPDHWCTVDLCRLCRSKMQAHQHMPPIAPVPGTQQHLRQAAASRAQPRYVVACTSNAQPAPPDPPPQQPAGGIPLGTPRFGGGDGSFRRSNTPQSTNPQQHNSNWALMGRVVQSSALDIASSPTPRQRVVIIAAARSIGVSEQEMAGRMQELVTLLPDLSSMLFSLHPSTLAQLTADTAGLAQKLVQLRVWFPTADLAAMVSRRPTLLLDEHWAHVDFARLRLLARLLPPPLPAAAAAPDGQQPTASLSEAPAVTEVDVAAAAAGDTSSGVLQTSPLLDGLVSRQPLLLVAEVDGLLDELSRLLPHVDVLAALQQDPDLVTSVMCNRNLSIWLMPGVSVLPLLERNPSLLFSVQRGSGALGPGAEFMGQG